MLSRQQALQQQIDASREQLQASQQQLQALQQQVDRLACDAAASQYQQLGVLAGLQHGATALSDRLAQQVAMLRREMRLALQAAEVSDGQVVPALAALSKCTESVAQAPFPPTRVMCSPRLA
jgi:septal ring factor EnvC (AmiA/AmiB activator)